MIFKKSKGLYIEYNYYWYNLLQLGNSDWITSIIFCSLLFKFTWYWNVILLSYFLFNCDINTRRWNCAVGTLWNTRVNEWAHLSLGSTLMICDKLGKRVCKTQGETPAPPTSPHRGRKGPQPCPAALPLSLPSALGFLTNSKKLPAENAGGYSLVIPMVTMKMKRKREVTAKSQLGWEKFFSADESFFFLLLNFPVFNGRNPIFFTP